jgi:hypothetical protein
MERQRIKVKNIINISGIFEIYLKIYFNSPSFLDIRTGLYNLKKIYFDTKLYFGSWDNNNPTESK